MQVQQIAISKFLKSANSLIIPVYQRDYAWRVENCRKLWQDNFYKRLKFLNI